MPQFLQQFNEQSRKLSGHLHILMQQCNNVELFVGWCILNNEYCWVGWLAGWLAFEQLHRLVCTCNAIIIAMYKHTYMYRCQNGWRANKNKIKWGKKAPKIHNNYNHSKNNINIDINRKAPINILIHWNTIPTICERAIRIWFGIVCVIWRCMCDFYMAKYHWLPSVLQVASCIPLLFRIRTFYHKVFFGLIFWFYISDRISLLCYFLNSLGAVSVNRT